MNMKTNMTNFHYPKYNLIICCNSLGYVPMLILGINSNFSFLLIPMNFLLGIIISVLVGFNLTLNIYLLEKIKSMRQSKRNFFSYVGISSGLFVGCPTCAGSFFYSLAGFSSLITFSYLKLLSNYICNNKYTFIDLFNYSYGKIITEKIYRFVVN